MAIRPLAPFYGLFIFPSLTFLRVSPTLNVPFCAGTFLAYAGGEGVMFGYIAVNKPELKIREFDRYRAWYCGLCHAL